MSRQKTNARTLCTRANFPETSFCLYFATNANVIDSPVINIVQESTKKQNMVIIKPKGINNIEEPNAKM